ncbi:hypothetical protein B0T11DRAFT_20875 [Plectosphaerella cucumerina]|uniref:Uncharacterized protein n=1 Tax=Plectosphaerella cucumerina TaxID=40658 RepID=A0A8K0TQ55_9PEZI|nr:hypothetical protein B0T11DRAFT_20875 [Plectosphaerella cucumerina]
MAGQPGIYIPKSTRRGRQEPAGWERVALSSHARAWASSPDGVCVSGRAARFGRHHETQAGQGAVWVPSCRYCSEAEPLPMGGSFSGRAAVRLGGGGVGPGPRPPPMCDWDAGSRAWWSHVLVVQMKPCATVEGRGAGMCQKVEGSGCDRLLHLRVIVARRGHQTAPARTHYIAVQMGRGEAVGGVFLVGVSRYGIKIARGKADESSACHDGQGTEQSMQQHLAARLPPSSLPLLPRLWLPPPASATIARCRTSTCKRNHLKQERQFRVPRTRQGCRGGGRRPRK